MNDTVLPSIATKTSDWIKQSRIPEYGLYEGIPETSYKLSIISDRLCITFVCARFSQIDIHHLSLPNLRKCS